VVLPRTNLGLLVRHGIDAYVLQRADAAGIAAAVIELRRSPTLARQLAAGAIAFGQEHFSWSRSAAKLEEFYLSLLEPRRAPTGPGGSG
jgi:glycosyltransferase involved in cell wall biosynthesis